MTTELCGEDVIARITNSSQIITTETVVATNSNAVVTAAGRAQGGGVELGRRLLLAARAGDTAAVLDLMAKGAPFNTDWLGTSPLHLAAANNHEETCAVLLRAGVSRDSRTKVERTPLHLAAHAGHARIVALLLDHGAMLDCRDMLRMTPLHWAAARGHAGAARELLSRGADPRLRCKFRKTPRCLAARRRRHDLVALLDAALADLPEKTVEESMKIEQEIETIQRIQEIKPHAKIRMQPEKTIIIESKTEPVPASMSPAPAGGGGGGDGSGGAAALLRAHGITLLPADRGCTVLTALRSGRTVVLSDAGKLLLKESGTSSTEPHVVVDDTLTDASTDTPMDVTEASVSEASASASASGSSVSVSESGARLVRAVRAARNVKVVTLNKQQPLKKIINPQDLQHVKLVQVSAGGTRPALKLMLKKTHLQRLLPAPAAPQAQAGGAGGAVGAGAGGAVSAQAEGAALRAQLAAAHATLADMAAELRRARERLAQYEPDAR